MQSELESKNRRLGEFLDRHQLDGVLLTLRNNFAWITCGRDNHIANNTPLGVASILATRDGKRICLANTIESPRMKQEELVGAGIETIDFPWWDAEARARVVRDVIGSKKIATDSESFGLSLRDLPVDFNELRWSLTPQEIERYRDGAKRASIAMELTCHMLKPLMSEHDVAGLLDQKIHSVGLNPLVTLVSSDQRLPKFRHPIPTVQRIRDYVMLVTCAEFGGLISCLTRFVRFSKPTDEQRRKQQAICNIDTAVNLATKPGRTLGEIFDDLRRAYADAGFPDEWQNHHQGGSTGYAGREVFAVPGSSVRVAENQAFAWNPSIVGAKSEDTVLATNQGVEVLTASQTWPMIEGKSTLGSLPRPDVLTL